MVDWSAASARKTGKDSVWWCLCLWPGGRLVMEANENPPTRQRCFDVLRTQLRQLAAEGGRTRDFANTIGVFDQRSNQITFGGGVSFQISSDRPGCVWCAPGRARN